MLDIYLATHTLMSDVHKRNIPAGTHTYTHTHTHTHTHTTAVMDMLV